MYCILLLITRDEAPCRSILFSAKLRSYFELTYLSIFIESGEEFSLFGNGKALLHLDSQDQE